MTPTPQQSEIISAFAAGTSLAVRAVAGAGKTSTIKAAWHAAPREGLALAFNKRVAEDLVAALPPQATVKTLNALGHAAWGRHLGRRLNLDTDKAKKLANTLGVARENFKDFMSLLSIAKAYGYVPPGALAGAKSFHSDLAALADEHDIPEHLCPIIDEALRRSIRQAWDGTIDFSDQIYMPNIYSSHFQRFPLVAIDEAQDLSALQHNMVRRSLAEGGQIIVVGDPRQAIYAWRGALSSSYDDLVEEHSLPILPLTRSFRCPRAVVLEAQKYVPEIEAFSEYDGVVTRDGLPLALGHTFLARLNSTLMREALALLRRGILPNYAGRDFLSGLKRRLAEVGDEAGLERWWADAMAEGSPAKRNRSYDRYLSLKVLFEQSKAQGKPPTNLLDSILKAPTANSVLLSTIHKAKGLEWPIVHLALGHSAGTQESNVAYVGITRAQRALNFISEDTR